MKDEPRRPSSWSYPETSATLLRTLRETRSGVDDAAWARFVDMYGPVVHNLVRLLSPRISDADTDDAVQDIFIKLIDILRSGAYDSSKSRFRTYLSALARRLLIDRYRAAAARRVDRQVTLEEAASAATVDDPGEWMDAKWRVACRLAAERRVMEESAISGQTREIWRLVSVEGLTVKEISVRLQMTANTVSKTKRRIEAMIDAVAGLYARD